MRLYLERYNITSCQSFESYRIFTVDTDSYIYSNHTIKSNDYDSVYSLKIEENSIANIQFIIINIIDLFVLNDKYAETILNLIEGETLSIKVVITIPWSTGSKTLREIYDSHIKNTPHIMKLIKYELSTLQIISQINNK